MSWPRQIRIGTVIEQPTRTGGIPGKGHHVHERRYCAGNPVHVDAEPGEQIEGGEIATTARNMHRDAVGGIGSSVEQHLPKRQVADGANRAPQCRPRKLRMPVPVILGIRIRAQRAQPASDRDQSVYARRRDAVHRGMADIEERLPVLRSGRLGRELRTMAEPRFGRRGIAEDQRRVR